MRNHILVAGLALAIMMPLAIGSAAPTSAQQEINPADFSPTITNPLFPLSLVGPKVFEGEETDPDTGDVVETRLESRVLPETAVVAGVTVTVLEEKAYEDGELVEVALDHFAQHRDGSVWYFGEFVDNYEDGQLKDHAGQWFAGEGGNKPGVIMPAQPVVGQTFQQEDAPGIAEDKATVLALDETVTVPAGTYENCTKTREFTPLEPGIEEFKWHCPGAGMVKEEGDGSVNELTSIAPAPAPTPAAAPSATGAPATPPTAPPSGVVAPATGAGTGSPDDSGGSDAVVVITILLVIALGLGITRTGSALHR